MANRVASMWMVILRGRVCIWTHGGFSSENQQLSISDNNHEAFSSKDVLYYSNTIIRLWPFIMFQPIWPYIILWGKHNLSDLCATKLWSQSEACKWSTQYAHSYDGLLKARHNHKGLNCVLANLTNPPILHHIAVSQPGLPTAFLNVANIATSPSPNCLQSIEFGSRPNTRLHGACAGSTWAPVQWSPIKPN